MSETKTLTLSEFLKARLAEREQLVHEAQARTWSGETPRFYDVEGGHRDDWGLYTFHVAPDFVLEDIMSKQTIVDLHAPKGGTCSTCCGEPYCEEYWNGEEESYSWERADLDYPCPTLRLLAAPFRKHPDFRAEWS